MKKKWIVLWVALGIFLMFLIYAFRIEPYQVEVRHIRIKDMGINTILADKTAIHLSDLHISQIGKREEQILKSINNLKPDLIFLTGDYVKWGGDYEPALTFLSRLKATIGVYAVMGDYDYSSSRKSCLFCHQPKSGKPTRLHKVIFLKNKMEKVSLPNGYLLLGGVDQEADPDFFSDNKIPFPEGKTPAIILSHSPLAFDLLDKDHDVLMLAGDTHGGQVYLPLWMWSILRYEKCARYNHGLYQEGRKTMYVSRGIGTSHLPIRILCPPELVVFHF